MSRPNFTPKHSMTITTSIARIFFQRYLLANVPKKSFAFISYIISLAQKYKEYSILPKKKREKEKTERNLKSLSVLSFLEYSASSGIIFRDAHQILITSYDPWHDEKPILDDRSLLSYARGSHACLHGDDCAAEMFFSLLYLIFIVIIQIAILTILPKSGCKITYYF